MGSRRRIILDLQHNAEELDLFKTIGYNSWKRSGAFRDVHFRTGYYGVRKEARAI